MENNTGSQKKILVYQLKEVYWIEKHLLKILPRYERAATTRYLKASFKGHFQATQQHINRLNQVFEILNEKVISRKAKELEGIILKDLAEINSVKKETLSRDLILIEAVARIEKYEIARYTELISMGYKLGEYNVVTLLEETLTEEMEAEETFEAIKEDTLKDELFITAEETIEELEVAEE